MQQDCHECAEIIAFEKILNEKAKLVTERVQQKVKHIVERNNERWRKFAYLCNLPLIGNLVFKYTNVPPGLEEVPLTHWREQWYVETNEQLLTEARTLEKMKKDHMEHWGDETVEPCDSTDPAGYYTPSRSTRRDCYAHGFNPWTPLKYDIYSDRLVFCSVSKKLVPKPNCDMESGPKGPFYYSREFTKMDYSETPRFNEWRPSDYYNRIRHHMRA